MNAAADKGNEADLDLLLNDQQASVGKELAKLAAQSSPYQFGSLRKVLQDVFSKYPNVKGDPRLVWNMDETEVSFEMGKRVKVFDSKDQTKVPK